MFQKDLGTYVTLDRHMIFIIVNLRLLSVLWHLNGILGQVLLRCAKLFQSGKRRNDRVNLLLALWTPVAEPAHKSLIELLATDGPAN